VPLCIAVTTLLAAAFTRVNSLADGDIRVAAIGFDNATTCWRSGLTLDTLVSIVHHMVNYKERQLDHTFAALGDRTRRAILARLEREHSASVTKLAKPFAIKLPAVMKHLDVLDEAGLITRSKAGRIVTVRLRLEPMRAAMDWLRRYERFWSKSLDRLAAYAESKEAEARKKGR
jgi:DNA-binding transcriptional ArsR family regulator